MLKKKSVIILGVGKSQIPIIKYAKKLGLFVIGVDINQNLKSKNLCNYFINCSTYNFNEIKKKLKILKNAYKILAILNRSSGPPVITTAKLNKYFKLKSYPAKSAELIINKHKLSIFCKKNNIKYPRTFHKNKTNFLFKNLVNSKYIIKPSLGLIGKKNIFLAKNISEIKKYSIKSMNASLNSHFLIQEYIDGRDVTLFSFVKSKKINNYFLLDEFNTINKKNQISDFGYSIPSIYSKTKIEKKILIISQNIISKLLIDKSIFISSFRIKDDNIFLIEIHLEMGGQLWYEKLFPKSMNNNLIKETIDFFIKNNSKFSKKNIKPTFIKYCQSNKKLISDSPIKIYQYKNVKLLNKKINTLVYE